MLQTPWLEEILQHLELLKPEKKWESMFYGISGVSPLQTNSKVI